MEQLIREARFALRRLARRPLITLATVGTLGLGIGAATAIFTVVDGVVLRPLPYPRPDELVLVGHRSASGKLGMPDGGYFYYLDHASTLESLAVYIESSSTVAGAGEPVELGIIQATPSLFPTLGVTPFLGRAFSPDDAKPGAPPVAVVSYGYWQRMLGGDPEAVGKPILRGEKFTVAGVLPAGFEFPRPEATVVFGNPFEAPDIYVPLSLDRSVARFGNFMYQGIGRLAPGATPEGAERELSRLMPQAAETFTGSESLGGITPEGLRKGRYRPVVATAKDAIVGDLARVLWILMAAVSGVLVIAAANVANLFLVRAEARRGEIAIQRALGAGRRALVRSSLCESTLLAAAGGALGLLLAWLGTGVLLHFAPRDLPRLDEVSVDPTVVAFAAGLTLLLGIAFGCAPLFHGAQREVGAELRAAGRGETAGHAQRRGRQLLVVVQVALALVLLVASGLLLRTVANLWRVEPGFDRTHVLTLRLSLGDNLVRGAGYDDGPDDAVRSRFMIDLVDRLAALPGVEKAAFTADLPLDGAEFHDYVAVEGAFPENVAAATKAMRVFIGPGYLDALGARLAAGRELEAREFAVQPRSVVVNQAFAAQRWPNENPVGKRLMQYWSGSSPQGDVWYTVAGVVEDIREASLMTPAEPTVYLPTVFLPDGGFAMWVSNMAVVLRTAGPPEALIPSVRAAIHDFQPEIPINTAETLEHLTARSFQQVTFAMVLLILAGAVSSVLALVGIYGTVAYVVSRRTREFGVRIALGASGRDIRGSVLGRAGAMGACGIALGLAGAAVAGRVLESLLFGVATTDPVVIAAVAVGLFAAVVVASLAPAARAAAVDPVEAMRVE